MNVPKVEKSETRTRSHPRLFLWLVVSLKVVCLRPEKGSREEPQGRGKSAPEDSTVPAERRQVTKLLGPSLQQSLEGLWAQF